jgi:plastocyanin
VTRTSGVRLAVLAIVAAAAILLGREWVRSRAPDRTIHLSMKGYAFNDSNPTLTLRAGERVRFVLTNDEEGMSRHDFEIVGTDTRCGGALLPGQQREIVVTMPGAGVYDYRCCTHPGMGGKIVVTP